MVFVVPSNGVVIRNKFFNIQICPTYNLLACVVWHNTRMWRLQEEPLTVAPPLDHNVKKAALTAPPVGRMIGHLSHPSVAIWITVITPTASLLRMAQFMWKLVCVLLDVRTYLLFLCFLCSFCSCTVRYICKTAKDILGNMQNHSWSHEKTIITAFQFLLK